MTSPIASKSRREGIESLRFIAAIAVVLIHFWPRSASSPIPLFDALLVGTCRFAVPFFFAVSGYFLANKLDRFTDGLAFAWRWLRILLVWHLLHALWFSALHLARVPDPWHTLPDWIPRLLSWNGLMEGVGWHLWYLHSLVFCVLLTSAVPKKWRARALLPLGVGFFAVALAWGPWRSVLGQFVPFLPIYINPRGFLFTALLPFALGLVSNGFGPLLLARKGVWLALAGLGIQTAEILLFPASPDLPQEYFLGSVLFGVGLLWLGLSWRRGAGLGPWGSASLPMYLAQFMLFAPMARVFEFVLRPLGPSPWGLQVLAVLCALPFYAWVCRKAATTSLWQRIHS